MPSNKRIHVRYNMPDDEWHSAYFDTDPAADAFTQKMEDLGVASDYHGWMEVPS